jgi:hypothetical protein
MTEPRNKGDKEAGNLSETAKTLCREMYLFAKYGYKENVFTDELYKGLICEQDSMKLVQDVLGGEFRTKNNANIVNKCISGKPDIILKKELVVEDLKTSWNLRTFFEADGTDYQEQLQGYMALTGLEKARLIYCLVQTPFEIIEEQKKRLFYKFDCNEDNKNYIEMCQQIEHNNNVILTIPKAERIKVFNIERDDIFIENIYKKVVKGWEYMAHL